MKYRARCVGEELSFFDDGIFETENNNPSPGGAVAIEFARGHIAPGTRMRVEVLAENGDLTRWEVRSAALTAAPLNESSE